MLHYEIKFSLNEVDAQRVRDWGFSHLAVDPHASDAEAGTYSISTLYLDNEPKDVYWRRGNYRHHKLRLRRYGNESVMFLERKSRWRHQVEKYRTVLAESELPLLASCHDSSTWTGSWFHQRVLSDGLKPSYQIGYERSAYVGPPDGSPMRLTMDWQIGYRLAHGWAFADSEGIPLFGKRVILELKYCGLLPSLFQNLIQSFDLKLKRISKYRLAVQASEHVKREGQLWLPYVNGSSFTELRDEVTSR